jgi:hypothetical protein
MTCCKQGRALRSRTLTHSHQMERLGHTPHEHRCTWKRSFECRRASAIDRDCLLCDPRHTAPHRAKLHSIVRYALAHARPEMDSLIAQERHQTTHTLHSVAAHLSPPWVDLSLSSAQDCPRKQMFLWLAMCVRCHRFCVLPQIQPGVRLGNGTQCGEWVGSPQVHFRRGELCGSQI